MSRSRKKIWGYKDSGHRFYKSYANRRIRRIPIKLNEENEFNDPIGDHKCYRRYNDPWGICDWTWIFFSRQSLKEWLLKYNGRWLEGHEDPKKALRAEISRYRQK